MKTPAVGCLPAVFFALMLCCALHSVFADEEPSDGAGRGDYLTIKLAVIGPGDEFFTWWGHLAVIVENRLTGRALLYDYGVFSFEAEHFYRNLIAGNWYYSMMVRDARQDIDWYINDNRDIIFYTLNLSASQKKHMLDFLNWNVLPENRRYYYKIFTDNCVTRVLLLLDDVLKGQFLERYRDEPGRLTARAHANRHLYRSPPAYWLLNFIMGQPIDEPSTKLIEMYLPEEFGKCVADFTYTGEQGTGVPLVQKTEVINTSQGRKLPLYNPPRDWIAGLILGLALAGVFAFAAFRYYTKNARRLLGITQALWALFLGLCGTLLFYGTFFSNHIYTYQNCNVVFINPVLLAGVPLALVFAFARKRKSLLFCSTALQALWTYVLLGGLLTFVIKISPAYYQSNRLILLSVMPPALALSFAGKYILRIFIRRTR